MQRHGYWHIQKSLAPSTMQFSTNFKPLEPWFSRSYGMRTSCMPSLSIPFAAKVNHNSAFNGTLTSYRALQFRVPKLSINTLSKTI